MLDDESSATASSAHVTRVPAPTLGAGVDVSELAFFLDVDGTLLEIAATPDAVVVEPQLIALLRRLVTRSGGAVAFVSGRSITVLDQLFQPLILQLQRMT